MQLKQKYTIYNITYENELFISDESTNVNIKDIMQHFFNSVQPVFNNSCSCHSNISTHIPCHSERSEESDTNSVKNNEAEEELKPDSEKSKSEPVKNINIIGFQIPDKKVDKAGFYIKFKVGNDIIEKWSRTDSEDNAKTGIYNYISKLKKERNDTVDYEILEIKAMILEEYNNKKSE